MCDLPYPQWCIRRVLYHYVSVMLNTMRTNIIFLTMLVFASCTQPVRTDNEVIICPIEQQPEFPGGIEQLKKYVRENSNWSSPQETVHGNVFVGFVVKK